MVVLAAASRPEFAVADYTPAPCPAVVAADSHIECGVLRVPESRRRPGVRTITLAVAALRSMARDRKPDPIVVLSGGPGQAALPAAKDYLRRGLGGERDVILVDQRGTGSSDPALTCPEMPEAILGLFTAAEAPRLELKSLIDTTRRCRDRLQGAGFDLGAYTTQESAADFADLRVALGIDAWNLLAVSYGSTLALEMMRSHPEGIRSAVLDSPLPTNVGYGGSWVRERVESLFRRIEDACALDPQCTTGHPDLRTARQELVRRMNAAPITIPAMEPEEGGPSSLVVTGDDALAFSYFAAYRSDLVGLIPALLEGFDGPLVTALPAFVDGVVSTSKVLAQGMTLSVSCADRGRLDGAMRVRRLRNRHPEYTTLLALLPSPDTCSVWSVPSVPRRFNRPVRSNIPTLIMSGQFDPITPPADAQRTARTLARGQYVEFPGLGHGVLFTHPCADDVFRSFLDDPIASVPTECLKKMPAPVWQ